MFPNCLLDNYYFDFTLNCSSFANSNEKDFFERISFSHFIQARRFYLPHRFDYISQVSKMFLYLCFYYYHHNYSLMNFYEFFEIKSSFHEHVFYHLQGVFILIQNQHFLHLNLPFQGHSLHLNLLDFHPIHLLYFFQEVELVLILLFIFYPFLSDLH